MPLEKFKRIDFQLDWANRYLIGEEVTAVENGDVKGRTIRMQITNMGDIEDLSNYTVLLYWKHTVVGNSGMNTFTAVDPANGIFEVVLSPEMLVKAGLVQGNIAVINGATGSQMLITSRLINIRVESSIMAFASITSTDDYSTLKEIVMLWKELPELVGDAVDYLHTLTDQVVEDSKQAIATSLDQQVAAAIQAGMPSKAEDSAVVHNSGNETIAGTKIFTSPIVGSLNGNASTATHADSASGAEDFKISGKANIKDLNVTGEFSVEKFADSYIAIIGGDIPFTFQAPWDCSAEIEILYNGWGFNGGEITIGISTPPGITQIWESVGYTNGHNLQAIAMPTKAAYSGLKKGQSYTFNYRNVSGQIGGSKNSNAFVKLYRN